MNQLSVLMVPVHLDALVLNTELQVVAETADFSRLPYFNATHDLNGATAYLSEMVLSPPFQNRNLYLPPGVHLHWSLPDALTRATRPTAVVADEDPDDLEVQEQQPQFPRVPNRWLVVRSRPDGTKAWIIESDYLCVPDPNDAAAPPDSASFLLEKDSLQSSAAPFRYLGRVRPFGAAHDSEPSTYLPRLTAVGYGEPTFAALYANCRNVFGLRDDSPDIVEGQRYDLLGWYEDREQDYLRDLMMGLRLGPNPDPDALLARLAGKARWAPLAILRKGAVSDDAWNKLLA